MSVIKARKSRAGRKRINYQAMSARFPEGTFERMDAALRPKEKRADLIRAGVERELRYRASTASARADD